MMPQTGFQDKAPTFNLNAAKGYMSLRHCHNNRSIMQRSVSLAPVGESHGISVFLHEALDMAHSLESKIVWSSH